MQNGSEFYIIDMQEPINSTYYNETVKEDLRNLIVSVGCLIWVAKKIEEY